MNQAISSIRTIGAAAALWLATSVPAHAAQPTPAAGLAQGIVPILLIMGVFYFLLIRPQQKRMKEHKAMVDGMKKGDKIVTGGGIIGTVVEISDDEVKVEIAEGTRVRIQRNTIVGLHK